VQEPQTARKEKKRAQDHLLDLIAKFPDGRILGEERRGNVRAEIAWRFEEAILRRTATYVLHESPLLQHLKAADCQILREWPGGRALYFWDPFGLVLDIIGRSPGKAQDEICSSLTGPSGPRLTTGAIKNHVVSRDRNRC